MHRESWTLSLTLPHRHTLHPSTESPPNVQSLAALCCNDEENVGTTQGSSVSMSVLLPPGSPPVDMSKLTAPDGLLATDPMLSALLTSSRPGELASNSLQLDTSDPSRAAQLNAMLPRLLSKIIAELGLLCGAQIAIGDAIYACKGGFRPAVRCGAILNP